MREVGDSYYILRARIDALQPQTALEKILSWFEEPLQYHYISSTNVNNVMNAVESQEFLAATNEAALSLPDGVPFLWYGRRLGHKLPRRCGIQELMFELFELSNKGYDFTHYFYGNTETVLTEMLSALKEQYPNLRIAGTYSPPFRDLSDNETDKVIETINSTEPDFLWVSLGCPKQELWMYRNRHRLKARVAGGAGAVFNFIAGHTRRAPAWIQYAGLEWLFRLMLNPTRLWRRYLVKYPKFLGLFLVHLVKGERN